MRLKLELKLPSPLKSVAALPREKKVYSRITLHLHRVHKKVSQSFFLL